LDLEHEQRVVQVGVILPSSARIADTLVRVRIEIADIAGQTLDSMVRDRLRALLARTEDGR
jgi:hypothetical protein